MARKPRSNFIGYHHVENQGINKGDIFATIKEKEAFLELLCDACHSYSVTLHDYCIMDNHYHLLVETRRENLSFFMRQINGKFATESNRKQNRTGPVWQGRYKSWYILHHEYLEYTIKHIEHEPVRNSIAFFVADYPYTLSAAILGSERLLPCAENSIMVTNYSTGELKALLKSDLTKDELEAFEVEKRKKITKCNETIMQDRSTPLADYFLAVANKGKRNKAMQRAYLDGYTQGDIARELGVSSALVSYCIKKL